MRNYAAISPRFWTPVSPTGREIRKRGPLTQLVALYLLSSPHSTMVGIYYLPKMMVAHETGLSMEQVESAFVDLIDLDFVRYDADCEYVFVPAMARWQVGETLKEKDKRRDGVENDLNHCHHPEFAQQFRDIYAKAYCINAGKRRGTEGASKGHASPIEANDIDKDSDKVTDNEQKHEQEDSPCSPPRGGPAPQAEAAQAESADKAKPNRKPKRGPLWHFVPDGEELTPPRRSKALELGVADCDVERVWSEFADHEFQKPKSHVDRTWANWCRRDGDYRRGGGNGPPGGGGSRYVPPDERGRGRTAELVQRLRLAREKRQDDLPQPESIPQQRRLAHVG